MPNGQHKQWSGKSRGGRSGYLFFVHIIRMFGVRVAYVFLAFIAVYFIPFAPKATAAIWAYNRRCRRLGVLGSICELYMHYFTFGQTLIDKIALRAGLSERYRFEFDNYSRFLEIINSGEGVVLIGAHVGCWEAGSVFFGKYGKKINIVMFAAEHQQIKEVLDESLEQNNEYKIIAINEDPIAAMLEMKIALNNGEYVCFNGDRYLDAKGAVEMDFMGDKALFPSGPFRIASKCRVPVVFYYSMREPNRTYRFIFKEAMFEGRPKADELSQQYVASLEEMVLKYPRQWFNFYKFWNIK